MLGFLFVQQTKSTDWSSVIWTVLTNKGKELKEINSLSDAIIHGRSGCGKTVPAGNGVFKEIRSAEKYQNAMMGTDSTAAKMVREKVTEKLKTQKSGNIIYDGGFVPNICFKCDTLGNFCGRMAFNATYALNEETQLTHVDASISYSGVDPWDFVPKEGVSDADNYWNEELPSKLVNLIGNYKEYDITYNIVEKVSFDY